MLHRSILWAPLRTLLTLAVFACAVYCEAAQPIAELRTVAEQSDYRATARYADVMAFCKALDEGSELVTLTEFGTTHEGRCAAAAGSQQETARRRETLGSRPNCRQFCALAISTPARFAARKRC